MERIGKSIVDASTTNQLAALSAFVSVVEAGSFSAAMKQTGVDKSLLSRRLAALEEALQTRLLRRTTRSLAITEAGQRLYERAAHPLAEVHRALADFGDEDTMAGVVRVATFPNIARNVIPRAAEILRRNHPALRLEFVVGLRFENLIESAVDVAIRSGHMPDSSLNARPIGRWRYVLCASAAWAAKNAGVTHPEDLAPHWLMFGGIPSAADWVFHGPEGTRAEVKMTPRYTADHGEVLLELLRSGLGVTAMPRFYVADFLARGSLVEVLPAWRVESAEFRIFGVWPHRDYLPRKTQAVLDAFETALEDLGMGL